MPKQLLQLAWLAAALAAGCSPAAKAQSTDGYHTTQVFPVVVDTASFTQRFSFRALITGETQVAVRFYPAQGTALEAPLACPTFTIGAGTRVFTSLRELCPGLPAGSQFGMLSVIEDSPENRPFSAFSRVSNVAGAGFAVEAFPAHAFTTGASTVAGLRRLAASSSAPAYQTNCFVATMPELTPPAQPPPQTTEAINVRLEDSAGAQIGNVLALDKTEGRFVRLLDVFGAVDAPPGDYDDVAFRVVPASPGTPAVVSFCTVQDNTSFGADFRIAKTDAGGCAPTCLNLSPADWHVFRSSNGYYDAAAPGDQTLRLFYLPPGKYQNSHVFYFRHPDYIQCELWDTVMSEPMGAGYGLEMRLTDEYGRVLAGGNDVRGFGEIYLGDKQEHGYGTNTRYVVQVETTEASGTAPRWYAIHCQSGSGHTSGDTIRSMLKDEF